MRKWKLENRNSTLERGVLCPEAGGPVRRIFVFPFSSFELRNRTSGWISALVALAMALADPAVALAQGCAMCYTAAAAAKAAAISALRTGILILLFPPALMFIAIFILAYRRRNRFNEAAAEETDERPVPEWFERLEPVEAAPRRDFPARSADPHRECSSTGRVADA